MNEYNPSGNLIDFSKTQILVIDYQWLGVGRIRIGFFTEKGVLQYCHNFNHSNLDEEVYHNQPSLPCRWEIKNIGTTSSSSSMKLLCSAVYCEGSVHETGYTRAVSTGNTNITLTIANSVNGYGILAVRLKNSLADKENRGSAKLKNYSIISNQDANYKIVILPDTNKLVNPNVTWTSIPGYSYCEYITNFSLSSDWFANNYFIIINDDYVVGGQGNKPGTPEEFDVINQTSSIYQNYNSNNSQILAMVGYRLTSDATIKGSFTWLEVK